MPENKNTICADCGKQTLDQRINMYDGSVIRLCNACFASVRYSNSKKIALCCECGIGIFLEKPEAHDIGKYTTSGRERYVCSSCHKNIHKKCSKCNKEFIITTNPSYESGKLIRSGDALIIMCMPCIESARFTCPGCDKEHSFLDAGGSLSEFGGQISCRSCTSRGDINSKIKLNYQTRLNPVTLKTKRNGKLAAQRHRSLKNGVFGLEIEVEGSTGASIKELHNKFNRLIPVENTCGGTTRLFITKRDGSLAEDGVEIVTQPLTYTMWKNKTMVDMLKFIDSNFTISNRCGVHISINTSHFTTAQKIAIQKAAAMIGPYSTKICQRNPNHYCDIGLNKRAVENGSLCNDHHAYLVFYGGGRTEFRGFAATKKHDIIMRYINFIRMVVDYALAAGNVISYDSYRLWIENNPTYNKMFGSCYPRSIIDREMVYEF